MIFFCRSGKLKLKLISYLPIIGLLAYSEKDLLSYKHNLILAMERDSVDPDKFTVLYNRFAIHSLPLGVNTFSNSMIKFRSKDLYEFVTSSHPLSDVKVNLSYLFSICPSFASTENISFSF